MNDPEDLTAILDELDALTRTPLTRARRPYRRMTENDVLTLTDHYADPDERASLDVFFSQNRVTRGSDERQMVVQVYSAQDEELCSVYLRAPAIRQLFVHLGWFLAQEARDDR